MIRGVGNLYGARELARRVAESARPWTFGIEDGELDQFLARYDLAAIDQSDAAGIGKRFLTDDSGHLHGQVNRAIA